MMLTMTSAWAGEVATYDLGTKDGVSTPAGFFKSVGEKWSWNSKFTGAEYDGIQFSQGLKMEGATKIGFTTTEVSTVTIVQSTWSDKTITFDDAELAVADAVAGTGCRIYTVKDVAAGDHVIGRGSGESGLFYVKVEWETLKTVTFINDANWEKVFVWAWNDTENFTGGEWPGVELTPDATGTYSWETVGSPTFIIFNNGAGVQTENLDFKKGGVYNSTGRVITKSDFTATFKTDGMDEVYAYAWNDSEKPLGDWPGTKMEGGNGEFTITMQAEDAPKYIIFHNNAGEQTSDLAFENGKVYEFMLNEFTATFTTDAGWTDVYAWAWTETGEYKKNFSESWPGEKLEGTDGVYTYSVKSFEAPHNILFNNGSDEGKTADLAFVDGKAYKWITATPYYALKEGDTFPAGTTVDLGDATITYGVSGGADFTAAVSAVNEDYAGFTSMTGGNGENGSADGGTVYTIKPVYDGTITVGVRLNGGKSFFILEDGESMEGYNGITIKDAANTSYSFPVKAGSTYKVYCTGSKLGFFGFDYKFTKPEVSITAVDLMGSSNEWAEPIATFGVEDASTGYWALNDVQFAANDEFKVRVSYSDQTEKWLAPVSEGNFLVNEEQLGKELELTAEGQQNMYVEKNAKLNFALSPGFDKLTITGEFAAPVEPIIPDGTYYVVSALLGSVINAESALDYNGAPITFTFDAATNTYAITGNDFFNGKQWTIAEAVEGMKGYYTISTVIDNEEYFVNVESDVTVLEKEAGDAATWILLQQAYWEDIVMSTYTVAGTKNLTGTENDWDIVEANQMTLNEETGLFEKKFKKIAVDGENQPEFKVVKTNMNGDNIWYPEGDNWKITTDYVGGEGIYDITITFDPSDFKEIGVIAEKRIVFPEDAIVFDFEAAAEAGENPGNKNGSKANGQAFFAWENADKVDSERQDYKGYEWAEGSVLPEVCQVWRRSDRINGNVKNGGLYCPNDREMAVNGLEAGSKVIIVYDAENATDKELVWAIGVPEAGPRATATIDGVELVSGESTIASGAEILVNSVTPAENGSGYIVFKVKKGMVIQQIAVVPAEEPAPAVDYFLVGNFNMDESGNWILNDENYKLAKNEEATAEEYSITVNLPANTELKVYGNDTWFPEGDNFTIGDAGNYTIYFRPVFNEEWNGYIYCQHNGEPDGINAVQAEKLNSAVIYNLNGQRVQSAQKGLYIVNGKKVVIK